ncbi:ribosomal RNA-processing protein 8 isoform X2 [Bicyclus anynana]|uniref:Ribosomal RNA-processing protein 8 n=1 Tax=Bicyclus anynana TaxID=110368 RepID=A0ABM3LG69_BICAN|nr:ribosomal RNA-processing protein 8 isoform X2 [Bicyclus anynana]
MFKVPDWDDVPNNELSFKKYIGPPKKQKNKKKLEQAVQVKPKFKAKTKSNSKLKLVNGVQELKKTEKTIKFKKTPSPMQVKLLQKKQSKDIKIKRQVPDDDIKITNYNSDKLDELILDVKKQKLDTYKNDDNEDILFQESPNNGIKKKVNQEKSKKAIDKTNIKMKKVTKPKPKLELSSPNEVNEKNIKDENKISKKEINTTENTIIKNVKSKDSKKKKLLKSILQVASSRNQINVSGNKLRERMLDRLKAAKFRYLNEKLYTSTGSDAQKLFQGDPGAFQTYHEGYQQQMKKWPVKPLDVIVKRIQKMPKSHVIADMGCGQAELSRRVAQAVRSFDLVGTAPGVEACDMAHTPLPAQAVHVAVYCLALMGTDLTQYLLEANRVLKPGGHLLIAEVESRFQDINSFTSDVQRLGFSLKKLDDTHKVFYFLEFTKQRDPPVKKGKLPNLTLKPCIYKKR